MDPSKSAIDTGQHASPPHHEKETNFQAESTARRQKSARRELEKKKNSANKCLRSPSESLCVRHFHARTFHRHRPPLHIAIPHTQSVSPSFWLSYTSHCTQNVPLATTHSPNIITSRIRLLRIKTRFSTDPPAVLSNSQLPYHHLFRIVPQKPPPQGRRLI